MITLSIDVKRLDKKRFKEFKRKDGSIGISCDLVMFETRDEPNKFIVKQSVSKEEGRIKMPILGNGKIWEKKSGGTSLKHTNPNEKIDPEDVPDSEEIPF